MGLFLTMSSIVGGKFDDVVEAMRKFAESKSGDLTQELLPYEEEGCLAVSEDSSGITVLLPHNIFDWDEISSYLSRQLNRPVFLFHIHDGDLWMYSLYEYGQLIDQFNPIPEYWAELDEQEKLSWQGDANKVAQRIPGLSANHIDKYLISWGDQLMNCDPRRKAYPTDQYYYGDDWQLIDFMKKLGFDYPIDDQGNLQGKTFRLVIEEQS